MLSTEAVAEDGDGTTAQRIMSGLNGGTFGADGGRAPDAMPDADLPPESALDGPAEAATHPLTRLAFLVGSVGLLGATATDAIAVLGRHTGFALLGSIEIVQVAVVLAASSAMIGATLQRSHASVHIVTERMRPPVQRRLARVAAMLGALLFLLIALGSAWVAADLWNGFERTELLGLPLRWFRLLWIVAALLIAVLFARQAVERTHG